MTFTLHPAPDSRDGPPLDCRDSHSPLQAQHTETRVAQRSSQKYGWCDVTEFAYVFMHAKMTAVRAQRCCIAWKLRKTAF